LRFPVADGWRAVFGAQFVSRISKLNNRKAGYQPKVSGIEGPHRIAEMQRCSTNQQVFECDADAVLINHEAMSFAFVALYSSRWLSASCNDSGSFLRPRS
jgi:hypothetical protein